MLGSVIASYLYKKVPGESEGYLTQMRSKIVSREHLNELGKDLNLVQFVESKVPPQHFGENIHGNLFEALVGAIFLVLTQKRINHLEIFTLVMTSRTNLIHMILLR